MRLVSPPMSGMSRVRGHTVSSVIYSYYQSPVATRHVYRFSNHESCGTPSEPKTVDLRKLESMNRTVHIARVISNDYHGMNHSRTKISLNVFHNPFYRHNTGIWLPSRRFSTQSGKQDSGSIEQDKEFIEWKSRVIGAQPRVNLKVGPYKRGKWFVSYKDDPGSFITNILILLVTGYSIFTMLPGESMSIRRQRKLRQLLLDNAQMTEADLNFIENYELPAEFETQDTPEETGV